MGTKESDRFSPQQDQRHAAATAPAPPNGGVAGWSAVFASFLLFATTYGYSSAYGAFQAYYESDLLHSSSPSRIAWIGTIQGFFMVSTGVFAGPLFDQGYLHSLMTVGCFLNVIGFMMLSLSTEYYQVFLSQGVCSGIGCGLIYVPALSLASTLFTTRRSIAVGLLSSGASIGGTVFSILFIRLQPLIGFPWTTRTMAFIQLACSCIAVPLLIATTNPRPSPPRQLIHWHALKELSFDAYALVNFLFFVSYFLPLFFIPSFAKSALHISIDLSVYMASIFNASSTISRIVAPLLVSRFGPTRVLYASMVSTTFILFGWTGVQTVAGSVVICVVIGISTGIFVAVTPVLMAHPVISPTPSVIGTRMGMQWFAVSLGVLIGAPIGGALQGHGGSNGALGMELFSAIVMALATAILLIPMRAIWRYDHGQREGGTV
ncbi:putative MFS monocarboxylate transporter [Aspergillus vadensis CBS 113365]|uniref:MFS general substrate transporter n=1 Tax=Aspergillus vadensis (strain CBS 113365 / IMI 142717 / IBT 24658) TaxID=1448311 RepID=A0A319BRL6_ASPVC|nr:MFS general substrate transporter [Aspergillus vadensis CBS 113365]PYH75097.1 MFS general substrate transporter [Aspergillus vadensis CBS 113365]